MKFYLKIRKKLSDLLNHGLDGACSVFLAVPLVMDWFVTDIRVQIEIICVGMLLYLLYYCRNYYGKTAGTWTLDLHWRRIFIDRQPEKTEWDRKILRRDQMQSDFLLSAWQVFAAYEFVVRPLALDPSSISLSAVFVLTVNTLAGLTFLYALWYYRAKMTGSGE